jgi:hypothetical protein
MPSGSECLENSNIERAARALPDSVDLVALLADDSSDAPLSWLEDLARRDPVGANAVRTVVVGAYYLNPTVRAALGYPGQQALPINALEYPEYLTEGLLEPVLSRSGTPSEGVRP